jgi:hypothetical protein
MQQFTFKKFKNRSFIEPLNVCSGSGKLTFFAREIFTQRKKESKVAENAL